MDSSLSRPHCLENLGVDHLFLNSHAAARGVDDVKPKKAQGTQRHWLNRCKDPGRDFRGDTGN
jgi:hypothetical protein